MNIFQRIKQLWNNPKYAAKVNPMAGIKKTLRGGDGWNWVAYVEGNDILVLNCTATAFGGDNDTGDDGETASGYNTKGHPDLIACSLPFRIDSLKSLAGSPIPKMPYGLFSNGNDNPRGAHVDITFLNSGKTVSNVPVVDCGPSKTALGQIDLTVALARMFDPKATANNFMAKVSYRILGGAKYAT